MSTSDQYVYVLNEICMQSAPNESHHLIGIYTTPQKAAERLHAYLITQLEDKEGFDRKEAETENLIDLLDNWEESVFQFEMVKVKLDEDNPQYNDCQQEIINSDLKKRKISQSTEKNSKRPKVKEKDKKNDDESSEEQ